MFNYDLVIWLSISWLQEKGLSLFEDSDQDGAVVSETDGENASNIKDNNEATSQEGKTWRFLVFFRNARRKNIRLSIIS